MPTKQEQKKGVTLKLEQETGADTESAGLIQDLELFIFRFPNYDREYEKSFPKAVECLEEGFEDSVQFYAFKELDSRKISSANTLERLNQHDGFEAFFRNEIAN